MHGLGNDFVIFNRTKHFFELTSKQLQHIANRHTGIGCDQILFMDPPTKSNMDFFYRVFNGNGSEAGQCGNGARCVTLLARKLGISQNNRINMQTNTQPMFAEFQADGQICINMGEPQQLQTTDKIITQNSLFSAEQNQWHLVSMGNPHAVTIVKHLDQLNIEPLASKLQSNPIFTNSVNVGFAEILGPQSIKLRVYERGAGETKACGSGACAAAVALIQTQQIQSPVTVNLPGGQLVISWQKKQPVLMCGPAEFVFEGQLEIE